VNDVDFAAITCQSRREQGLDDHVEDVAVLARVAVLLSRRDDADPEAEAGATTFSTTIVPDHRDELGRRDVS
jgi:hypothetical protein